MQIPTDEVYSASKASEWLGQVPPAIRPNMEPLHRAVVLFNQQAESAWQLMTHTGADYGEINEFQKIFGLAEGGARGLSA